MCVYKSNDGICKKYSDNEVLSYCVEGPCEDEVMTNADKIRSMTDEELAGYLCGIIDCEVCKSFILKNDVCDNKNGFPSEIFEWLKQESKGE